MLSEPLAVFFANRPNAVDVLGHFAFPSRKPCRLQRHVGPSQERLFAESA